MKLWVRWALPVLGMAVFVLLLYWPGLYGGFFFDDSVNFLEPAEIRIKDLTLNSLLGAWESGYAGPLGRPISMVSFALNHYFSGFIPFYFKLTNVVIHLLNGLLVYLLVHLIARAMERPERPASLWRPAAFMLALAWAIHPIQLTSVLYVVQRMTSLSSTFMLVGLVLHIWARQLRPFDKRGLWVLVLAWGVAFPMALLSKETGVLFVGYVFAYELIIRRHFNRGLDRPATWFSSSLSVGGVAFLAYLSFSSSWLIGGYEERAFSLFERLITEARIVWTYLRMIFVPSLTDFSLYHDDFEISKGLLQPASTLLAVAGIFVLFVIAWHQRIKRPLIAFAIAWFLIGHSLESTIFPLELMHEHRNYLPSLALVFLLMHMILFDATNTPALRTVMLGSGAAMLLYFGLLTYLRADMYGDDFRRTQIEAQYHSGSTRAQYEAGALMVNLYNDQRSPMYRSPIFLGMANKHFEQVNMLDPSFKLGLVGMLQLDCLSEKTANEQTLSELNRRFRSGANRVLDRTALSGIAKTTNEGTICLSRGQVDELFLGALSNPLVYGAKKSRMLTAYAHYLWLGQKDYVAALAALNQAYELNNDDVVNRLNAIQLFRIMGDKDGVLSVLAYLDARKISQVDSGRLAQIKEELVKDGVLLSNESKR
jgi:protein O-mannosyl-transferase